MTNIIADIAGNYKTLMALLDKMPDGEVVSVGDMVDRGPRSKEVLEWFMKNGKAVKGNHEHMMVDYIRKTGSYTPWNWLAVGGVDTLNSFNQQPIPNDIVEWLDALPLYMEIDDCLISHSFVRPTLGFERACDIDNNLGRSIIWNRDEPERMDKYDLQIVGHNSQFGLTEFKDDGGVFAVCLDGSSTRVLNGIHLPTQKIYQQDYID